MLIQLVFVAVASSALADKHYDYGYDHESYPHEEHDHKYHGPPAPLKHDGTVDYTPEVKHARASHFAALQAYKSSFPGHGQHYYHQPEQLHVPYSHFYNPNPAPVKHDGSVDDLPEVKAARAHHLAEYSKALYSRYKRSYSLGAPLKHDGTVDETPEVKHAKAVHFAALAEARSYNPHNYHGPSYSHGGYKHYFEPAPLNHDGTVADTDDVKHAKAILFQAHNEAKSRLHYVPHYNGFVHHYPVHDGHSDHSYSKHYHGPPAPLNHDGTVAETPEVKHAKAVHFQLYNLALHRHRRAVQFEPAPLNPDGTVAETPEVKHAKEAFFAAHAAEYAQADHSWVEPEYNNDEPRYHNYVEPIQYHSQHSHNPISKPAYIEPQHRSLGDFATNRYNKPSFSNHHASAFPVQKSFSPAPSLFSPAPSHFSPAPSHFSPAPSHFSPAPSHFSQYKKPVIPAPLNHDGTVAETPEIIAAKAIHFAAHQEAHSRIVPHKYSHPHY